MPPGRPPQSRAVLQQQRWFSREALMHIGIWVMSLVEDWRGLVLISVAVAVAMSATIILAV